MELQLHSEQKVETQVTSAQVLPNPLLPAVLVAHGEHCKKHKPILSKMGYVQSHEEAERRMKRGQKQKQCPNCLYWYFKDEY